jgi:hypothetical protein
MTSSLLCFLLIVLLHLTPFPFLLHVPSIHMLINLSTLTITSEVKCVNFNVLIKRLSTSLGYFQLVHNILLSAFLSNTLRYLMQVALHTLKLLSNVVRDPQRSPR